jgi:Putative DNA-binding domain
VSFFTTPLSQLSIAHLQELLDLKAVENSRLEFKREIPTKDETLKKLSSFANTFGGFMVIGAQANSEGRIEALCGVDQQAGYKQTLVQWSFAGSTPPLTIEVSDPIPVPASNGKFCYVIYTPESETAPHFLNGRRGVWVRTDEFSSRLEGLADEDELRHLFDRRRLIQERRARILERAIMRFDTHVSKTHTDLGGKRNKLGPCLEFSVIPRFPARQLCEQAKLKSIVQNSVINYRQITFPDPSKPIISQHESAIVPDAARFTSIFEVNVWGLLFYCVRLDHDHNGTLGIHLYQFVGRVLLFIHHANKMIQLLGYSGPLFIETTLRSILGATWLQPVDWGLIPKFTSELDDEVTFSIPSTTETLIEKPDGVVMEILRVAFFSVNCASFAETPVLESLIKMGYGFNFWEVPTTLRA